LSSTRCCPQASGTPGSPPPGPARPAWDQLSDASRPLALYYA
jgi:hypothetical protein